MRRTSLTRYCIRSLSFPYLLCASLRVRHFIYNALHVPTSLAFVTYCFYYAYNVRLMCEILQHCALVFTSFYHYVNISYIYRAYNSAQSAHYLILSCVKIHAYRALLYAIRVLLCPIIAVFYIA